MTVRFRTLHRKTCPCGQPFTTSDAGSTYHSKACGAYHRAQRDGMPVVWIKSSVEDLKLFRATTPKGMP